MRQVSLTTLQTLIPGTLMEHLGMEFTGMGQDFIAARMPVDRRTCQTFGILHGGASCALIESLGSVGAQLSIDRDTMRCFGLELNANHIRAVQRGYVYGVARPIHVGRTTQVWDVRLEDEHKRLTCVGRLTLAVRPTEGAPGAPLVKTLV